MEGQEAVVADTQAEVVAATEEVAVVKDINEEQPVSNSLFYSLNDFLFNSVKCRGHQSSC